MKIKLISPLSTNQHQYLQRVCKSWLNVAEGGKRGGKNIVNVLAFAMMLEEHSNRLHLVGAVSIANAKINVVDCDGYGLTNYFEGRCREGKYKNKDALYIKTKTGTKVIIIAGGAKDGDEKYIKGNSYGMAYITEVNECHPNFIREVFDRTLVSRDRKIFHDLNPKPESHYYYTDILKFHEDKQSNNFEYGFNYGHFTIKDNMSITQEELNHIIDTYDKKSVWYQRDILGLRKQAEGVIHRAFADNPEQWLIDKVEQKPSRITIGCDVGGNGSRTTFVATGFFKGYQSIVVLDEEVIIEDKVDINAMYAAFDRIYKRLTENYGRVEWLFVDSEATMIINSIRAYARSKGYTIKVDICQKGKIFNRIMLIANLLASDRMKILRKCENVIKSLKNQRWSDDKADTREDNGHDITIDVADGFEYSINTFAEQLARGY